MSANFNNSAWFYDTLSRMVYGRALVEAQVYLLQFIPANSSVLIIGGGTGWILEEITKIHASGLHITYVEVSEKMMALSKERNTGGNQVVFINDAIEHIDLVNGFDAVITPFLFDNFTEQTAQKIFAHIHGLLKPGGIWLYADFQQTGKLWQKFMLKAMFLFFRMLCNIEASQLPDLEKKFNENRYVAVAEETFWGDFIISRVYKRIS